MGNGKKERISSIYFPSFLLFTIIYMSSHGKDDGEKRWKRYGNYNDRKGERSIPSSLTPFLFLYHLLSVAHPILFGGWVCWSERSEREGTVKSEAMDEERANLSLPNTLFPSSILSPSSHLHLPEIASLGKRWRERMRKGVRDRIIGLSLPSFVSSLHPAPCPRCQATFIYPLHSIPSSHQ